MILRWPQITIAVLMAIGLGLDLERHGKPRQKTENFFVSMAATAIMAWILHEGGFW